MKVPLLDLNAQLQVIEPAVTDAVCEVVRSTRYIMGPKVTDLEDAIAEYCGVGFGIGVSSGTDALLVALMGLEVGAGDRVLTTPYSFFATAGAIARLGATPVFVDIDPATYNMCPKALASWVADSANLKNLKAIVPVHLYGQCADMGPIMRIANELGLPVIEDAAQAIGSRYEVEGVVQRAGSLGKIGCFSFFPSKNLGGVGDGGMVVTKDEELATKLRKLRNHGGHPKYYHQMIGGNFRLDPIQAAVVSVKLPYLESWHAARQANAAYYDEVLQVPEVRNPVVAQAREHHIYNQYVISVPDRDGLRKHLAQKDIGTEIYYPVPFHL